MSDIPTKTYSPEFLRAMIADHEAEQAGATPEASSAVETKGDAMSKTATGWQPIETAPRDGQTLLLWDAFREVAILGCWSDEWGGWEQEESYLEIPQPTYWMLIEPPPTGGRDE